MPLKQPKQVDPGATAPSSPQSGKMEHPRSRSKLTEAHIDTRKPQFPGHQGRDSKLPHEHDESVPAANPEPQAEIQQAHQDVKRGLEDTDARGKDGRPLGSQKPA